MWLLADPDSVTSVGRRNWRNFAITDGAVSVAECVDSRCCVRGDAETSYKAGAGEE